MAVFTFDSGSAGTGIKFFASGHQAVSGTGSWASARTTGGGLTLGKWYVEFLMVRRSSNGAIVGVTNGSGPLNSYLGSDSNSFGWQCIGTAYGAISGAGAGCGSHIPGDIISVAIDVPNKRAWNRVNGGAWTGGGDPAAGTSPGTWSFSGAVYLALSVQWAGSSYVINSGSMPFAYTPPSGFSAIGDATSWTTSGTQQFDSARVDSLFTLSNSNLTVTGITDGAYGTAIGKVLHTSGKHYVEFDIGALAASPGLMVGLCSAWQPPYHYETNAAITAGWQSNATRHGLAGTSGGGGFTYTTGDHVGMAWDADAKRLWIRKPNGDWLFGDPVAGTSGLDFSALVRVGAYPVPFITTLDAPTETTLNAAGPFHFASPFAGGARRRRIPLILEHSP